MVVVKDISQFARNTVELTACKLREIEALYGQYDNFLKQNYLDSRG